MLAILNKLIIFKKYFVNIIILYFIYIFMLKQIYKYKMYFHDVVFMFISFIFVSLLKICKYVCVYLCDYVELLLRINA